MKVEVNEKIIQQASECCKKLSCLDSCTRDVCPAQNGNNVALFVQAKEAPCPYKHPFGFGHYCDCPVRKELHKRYHI